MMLKTRSQPARAAAPHRLPLAPAPPVARRAVAARNMTAANLGSLSPAALQEALKDPAIREAVQKAMSDPEIVERIKALQQAMQNPESQRQLAQMQSFVQNPKLQERMKALKGDPEFEGFFADMEKNGMAALMKYYNDPSFLAKLSGRINDVIPAGAAGAAAAAGPAAPPEIRTLLDAARYGDLEAVEDFIAIGKDVNMRDGDLRTPLHYACAYAHSEIARLLLESGSEVEAADSKGNTPLHYAAGYGRPSLVRLIIDAGALKGAKNSTGKTAADLVAAAPQNPINEDAALIALLQP